MADRELMDLRRQIRKIRQDLEASERRRMLLRQQERLHGVHIVGVALGSWTRWMREHPVRLAVAAAVGLVAMTSLVDSSSIADDDPQRSHVAGPSEAGRSIPATNVTARLILAGSGGDEEPDAESAGVSGAEPDGELSEESGTGQAGDHDSSKDSRSLDRVPQATAGMSSEPTATPEPEATPSDPTTEPELSDTSDTDDPPASEPDPADSPEPQAPDDEADTSDGTCLGVSALGLTVDLCLPSLLG